MRAKFINEEIVQNSLWRSTDQDWLRIFLDQDQIIIPKAQGKFISLSFDSESGGQDNFGGKEITIEFDEDKVFQQNAIELIYDGDWFNDNPEISLYVTGYKGEKDYYDQRGFSGPEEANEKLELTWEQNVEDYSHEAEILLKKLKYVPGLIKYVYFHVPAHPILIDMLEENNIKYSANKGIEKIKKEKYLWESITSNKNLKYFEIVNNSKIGDILEEYIIYNYVEYLNDKSEIHTHEESFIEGDLGRRIEKYSKYKLEKVYIEDISQEFLIDNNEVYNYINLFKETNNYPPVVLEKRKNGFYTILDGAHRIAALDELNIPKVKAFVGLI